jgi:hypothetical protein
MDEQLLANDSGFGLVDVVRISSTSLPSCRHGCLKCSINKKTNVTKAEINTPSSPEK